MYSTIQNPYLLQEHITLSKIDCSAGYKSNLQGFHSGSVVRSFACQSMQETRVWSWSGRIHALRATKPMPQCQACTLEPGAQLQAREATTKPRAPEPCSPTEKPPQWEACAPHLESGPCYLQLEKPKHQWGPSTAKINKVI